MEEKTVTCDGDSQQQEDKQKISSTYNNGSDGNHPSAVECLRLKNNLMEILEELKMRRINDKENEERIKKADQEKYDLSRKCEAETQKLNESKEQFQKQIQDADRKCRERLSQTEEQLKQQKVFKDCTEKEINGLKDEIRNLEVVKYTLEKDLKEQERKLQLHVQSSEQHLNQLTETEHRFKALQLQCKQLSEAQAQLEDSVQHAVRHNQALLYINEHQKCILNEEKHHVSSLQSQLLEVKSHLQKKPDETSLQQYQMEIASLNQKIERLKAEKEGSSKEINECAAKYEKVSQLLQNTHKLLEHQIEIAEIHKKNASQQKTLIQQQQGELAEVKGELEEVKDKALLLRDQHKEEAEEWRKKTSQLQNELSEIKEDLEEQKKRCADLEDLNTTWSNQNIQLTEQLQFTKEQLNKPRQDQILQTELCLMKMVENESQVEVISTDSSVQTMSVPQRTNSTQTPAPELTVSKTQTNNPALANSSSQTERVEIQSVSVQAEIIKYNSKERLFCQSLSSANRSCKSVGQQPPVEVKTLCSQSNAVTLSDSQTLQISVSQSDSQLSAVTSQSMQTEPDQLQNPNCQHTSEYIDLAKTEDVNQRETAQQLPENGTLGENQENITNRSQVIQSYAIRRQSFQLLENTTSDEDKSIDQVTPVFKGVVDDKTSLICDKSMSTETLKHHSEMETDNLTKELLQNQVTHTETSEASTVKIDVHPTPSLATPIDRDQVSCDGLVVSRQDANDPAIDSTVPNDPDKSCVSPRSPGGSRLKLSLSRPKTLLTTPYLKSKEEDDVGREACKLSGKQTSSTMEQLDILLNSPMSDNQKDETGHQSLNYL
ncbi:coiled-coil domain-containing protein 73 [Magallana gigas]|uniref:coiled-coil domain-containing protein 73 n=1 Tax=Magallana gigas TaxID=29159 RepID=UPI00333E8D2C